MGDIHPAFARHEEFSPHAGHGVVDVYLYAALRQYLRRHQPGRAATNYGDNWCSLELLVCHVLEAIVKAGDYSVLWLFPSVWVQERIMGALKPEYYKEKIIEHS
jgi:hypothetical protein